MANTDATQLPQTRSQFILQSHFAKLVQYIDLKSLHPHLETNGLLTTHLREALQLQGVTDTEKKTQLLSKLLNNRKDFIDELIRSLRGANDHCEHERLAKLLEDTVCPPLQIERQGDQPETPTDVLGSDPHQEREELIPHENRTNPFGVLHAVCTKALICYLCFLVLFVLVSLTVIVPTAKWYLNGINGYTILNSMNQTVVSPLEQHLHSISLRHNHSSQPCILQSVAVPCKELKPKNTSNVTDPNFFSGLQQEYFYLLNGSNITLVYNVRADSNVTSFAFWVYNSRSEYKSVSDVARPIPCSSDRSHDNWPACHNYTNLTPNKTYQLTYTVQADSDTFYYFICQWISDDKWGRQFCSKEYFTWSIDVFWYDFSFYNHTHSDTAGSITTKKRPLILRKAFDPSLYLSEPKNCLLIHTPNYGSCESQQNGIVVTVSDIGKVSDIGFFAGISILFLVIVYVAVTVSGHVFLCRQERRRQLEQDNG